MFENFENIAKDHKDSVLTKTMLSAGFLGYKSRDSHMDVKVKLFHAVIV